MSKKIDKTEKQEPSEKTQKKDRKFQLKDAIAKTMTQISAEKIRGNKRGVSSLERVLKALEDKLKKESLL